MADQAFPVKTILLAAASAPVSYGHTIVRKSVPGVVALVIGYLLLAALVLASTPESGFNGLLIFGGFILCFACMIFGYTVLAVTFHRIFLLGGQGVPGFGISRWTGRETRFFGWGIAIGLLMLVMMVPLTLLFGAAFAGNGDIFDNPDMVTGMGFGPILGFYAFMLPGIYLISRWSVVFPATATDFRPSLGWAWGFTKRFHWQVAFTVGFATLAIELLTGMLVAVMPAWLATVTNIVMGIYLAIFGIAVLSFS